MMMMPGACFMVLSLLQYQTQHHTTTNTAIRQPLHSPRPFMPAKAPGQVFVRCALSSAGLDASSSRSHPLQ